MTHDLIERLRRHPYYLNTAYQEQAQMSDDMREAADLLEANAAEIERLKKCVEIEQSYRDALLAENEKLQAEIERLKSGFKSEEEQTYLHNEVTGLHNEADLQEIEQLKDKLEGRDKDWILAMGHALGLDSGYEVPIVPEVEPFKRLFKALAAVEQSDDQ